VAEDARTMLNRLRASEAPVADARTMLEELRAKDQPVIGAGTAAIRGFAGGALDGLLGIPDFLAKRAVDTVLPQIPGIEPTGLQSAAQQERFLPLPRGQDLIPGFDEAQAQHPAATAVGEAVGDGATLLAGRTIAKQRLQATPETGAAIKHIVDGLTKNPGVARAIAEQFQSGPLKSLANAAKKSLEAGLEGAAIAAIQGGDPLETAGYAAGAQVVGSAVLTPVTGVFSGGPMRSANKLAIAAVGVMSLAQILKSATPGGRDRILESIETGFDKVTLGIAVGALGAAVGAGRLSPRNVPMLTDAITSIPRGAAISMLNGMLKEKDSGIDTSERTLNHLIANPERFNRSQTRQIEAALQSGNLSETVAKMVEKDPRFARLIDSEPGVEQDFLTRGQRKQLNKARVTK